MKKIVSLFVIVLLFSVSLSFSTAFAEHGDKVVDDYLIDWGPDHGSGMWGFTYVRDSLEESGEMQTYFNIQGRWVDRVQRTIEGAYIDDGQILTTTIGLNLGADYSPYAALLDRRNLGIRISGFEFENTAVDATYIMAQTAPTNIHDEYLIVEPSKQEFALNVTSQDLFDLIDLNTTILRYTEDEENYILVLCNFTPVVYENYRIGVPELKKYHEVFNSDDVGFGGSGQINEGTFNALDREWNNQPFQIEIKVPPLAVVFIEPV